MKKFLVVLLSLGLIVAFGMTASAQMSVKFSGQYYVNGVYEDNRACGATATIPAPSSDPNEGADGVQGCRRPHLHDPFRRLRKAVGHT